MTRHAAVLCILRASRFLGDVSCAQTGALPCNIAVRKAPDGAKDQTCKHMRRSALRLAASLAERGPTDSKYGSLLARSGRGSRCCCGLDAGELLHEPRLGCAAQSCVRFQTVARHARKRRVHSMMHARDGSEGRVVSGSTCIEKHQEGPRPPAWTWQTQRGKPWPAAAEQRVLAAFPLWTWPKGCRVPRPHRASAVISARTPSVQQIHARTHAHTPFSHGQMRHVPGCWGLQEVLALLHMQGTCWRESSSSSSASCCCTWC